MRYLKKFENYELTGYEGKLFINTPSDNLIKKYWNNRDSYEKNYNKYSRTISQRDIVAAAKDKETVLQIASSKKYNI